MLPEPTDGQQLLLMRKVPEHKVQAGSEQIKEEGHHDRHLLSAPVGTVLQCPSVCLSVGYTQQVVPLHSIGEETTTQERQVTRPS